MKVDPSLLLEPAIAALAGTEVLVIGTTGGVKPSTIRSHDTENVRLEPFIPTCCRTSTRLLAPALGLAAGGYGQTYWMS